MKKIILLFVFAAFSYTITAQVKPTEKKRTSADVSYTSLKPADGQGAVFNSQEELDAKIESKKSNMVELIKANESDPIKVKMYREELWRFENAVVRLPGK